MATRMTCPIIWITVFKIRSETCWTEAQFCQNSYMIKKESLLDRHLFWRLGSALILNTSWYAFQIDITGLLFFIQPDHYHRFIFISPLSSIGVVMRKSSKNRTWLFLKMWLWRLAAGWCRTSLRCRTWQRKCLYRNVSVDGYFWLLQHVQDLIYPKVFTCRIYKFVSFKGGYRIKKKILPKSTCLTNSFTYPGVSGSGICRALHALYSGHFEAWNNMAILQLHFVERKILNFD